MTRKLRGLLPALVVPLDEDRTVLEREFIVHVQRLARVGVGVGGVIVDGHFGEGDAHAPATRQRLIDRARAAAPADFVVVAGVDGSTTADATASAVAAEAAGAQALLVHPPRGGLSDALATIARVESILEEVRVPVVVFDDADDARAVPTLETLARLEGVDAIVVGTPDPVAFAEIFDAVHNHVDVLTSAETASAVDIVAYGAVGIVAGTGNVTSAAWVDVIGACRRGQVEDARRTFEGSIGPLASATCSGVPLRDPRSRRRVKESLVQLGLFSTAEVLGDAPVPAGESERDEIRSALGAARMLVG